MSDPYTIELGDSNVALPFVPEGDDRWLERIRERKPGSTAVRIRAADDEADDTEGHLAGLRMRVIVETDDDTEGHAVSIHFPTRDEADALRRRLVVGGVLAGSVALGVAGGMGLSALSADNASSMPASASTIQADPATDVGLMDASGAAIAGTATLAQPAGADADLGIMDASGAVITGAAALTQPADPDADVGIMDASATVGTKSSPDEPPEPLVGPR